MSTRELTAAAAPGHAGLGAFALLALASGTTLGNVGGNVMPELLAGFGERFSLSDTHSGAVAAAQLLSTAVVTLALSARASRPGRTAMARWGLLIATLGFIAAWLSPSVPLLVSANIVAGAGLGAVFAAATSALSSTPDPDRATTRTVLAATIATAVLIVLVSLASSISGGTGGFAVLAACCLFGLWAVRGLPERTIATVSLPKTSLPLAFLSAAMVFGIVEQGTWSYTAVFGQRHAGLDDSTTSLVLGVAALAALIGVPLGAWAARRFGRVIGIIAIGVLEFAAKAVVTSTEDGTVFAIAACIWQICYLALLVQVLAVAANTDRSGRLVAATAGAVALGTGLGPAAIGVTLDAFGPIGLTIGLAAFGVLTLVPLARVASRVPLTDSAASATKARSAPVSGA